MLEQIYKTKIASSVVALAVGMSGCYGYQGRVLRDVDSVSSMPLSREVFERGFSDFYMTPADSLEQRVSPFNVMAAGQCPPYLPNCGKKKEEKKDPTDEEDEVFRGRNPPPRNNSSGSSNSSSQSPEVTSEKSHAGDWVMIGGGGLAMLVGASLTGSKTCASDRGNNYNMECGSNPATYAGYFMIAAGAGLVLLGIYGLASK